MATRSLIGRVVDDGEGKTHIEAIYCHYDGYPAGVGTTLMEHYTSTEKVEALIKAGSVDSLEMNPGNGKPNRTQSVYCGSINDFTSDADKMGAEWVYLYNNDEWQVLQVIQSWRPLVDLISEVNK